MGTVRKLLLSAGWALSLAIPAAARENFSAWKDSVRIFINTSAAGADLDASVKDFPLLVRLDSSSIDFSKVKAGGADLRFADPDGTLLPHEIELFEAAAKSCVAWVRVPQVDAQSVDDHIVLYWNNPAATALKAAVFDTSLGYAAVYHFGEEGAGPLTGPGTKGIFKDATPNQNHGDDFTSDPRARAVIGYGQEFDGMDDRVQVPNKPSLALAGPLSISAWVRGDQYAGNLEQSNVIVRKGDELPVSYQFGVMAGRAFLSLDEKTSDVVWSKGTLAAGTYYHLAGAWEGKTLKLYVNGVLDAEIAVSKSAGSLSKDARPMYVGGRMLSPFDFNSYDLWNGGLDEVRVSRVARSDQYYRLSYENQKAGSRLLSFKPFPPPASSEVLSLWAHSRKILFNTAADGADVAGDVEGFPVPVRLDSRFFTFSEAGAKGEDIRFSDPDGSPLPYAIERWDPPAGKALIWVKVPRVDGGSEADFIRMHWGMNGVPDRQSPTAVFDTAAGFAGVWHLESGAAGRTGTVAYLDQTAGRHHGSDFVLGAPTEGMLGFGQEFAENQDRIKVPAAPTLDFTAALTFSAWIKGTSWDTGETNANPILRKG